MEEWKICPHCGAKLPEQAAFCPYCARSINRRTTHAPPRHMPRRALRSALLITLAVILALAAIGWRSTRPGIYDNDSTEVIYRDHGVDYQVCIAWADAPFTPADRVRHNGGAPLDELYRYPVLLYVNLTDGETFAADEFLERVDSITGEISDPDEHFQISCSEAVRDTDYVPNSAAILYMNPLVTSPGDHSAELTVNIRMKNGDVIRLHQTQMMKGVMTWDFTAADAPMDTVEELEAFLAEVEEMVEPEDQVNIHLPPVTYTEELVIDGRPVNLIGSGDGAGARTAFTAPIQVAMEDGTVLFWENLDFTGPGTGTGLSVSARMHLTGCYVAGWDTGVLAHTNAWCKADESVFEDNAVGFCFSAEYGSPSDDRFISDVFRNNGTAVVLEQVPNQAALNFSGCRFSGNGTDIDNRCGQQLDVSGAFFGG